MREGFPREKRFRVRCSDWITALVLAQRAYAICADSLREISIIRSPDGTCPLIVWFATPDPNATRNLEDRLERMALGMN